MNIFYKIRLKSCLVFLLISASISACVSNSPTRSDGNNKFGSDYKNPSQSIPSTSPQVQTGPKKGRAALPHHIVSPPKKGRASVPRPIVRIPNHSTLPPKKLHPHPGPSRQSKFCASGKANINNIAKSCSNGNCRRSGVKIRCNNKSCQVCDARNHCNKILYNGRTSISGGAIHCHNGRCSYSVKNGGSRSNGTFSCR